MNKLYRHIRGSIMRNRKSSDLVPAVMMAGGVVAFTLTLIITQWFMNLAP